MIERHQNGQTTWIDVFQPETSEVRALMEEFSLRPSVAEELLAPTIRPKAEVYEDHLYVVLHFPALRHTYTQSSDQEVDFILTRNALITVRYDTVDALHKFAKLFEVESILRNDHDELHAGYVFFALLMKLYRSIGHELEYIHDRLEDVEERIYQGHEREMVLELSHISRDLLNIKQATTIHQDVLDSMKGGALRMYGDSFQGELTAIESEYYRITTLRSMNHDSLWELRKTNDSLLSTKQNEIMKTLTILAFVTFPLTLAAGIFGMNAKFMPIVGQPGDFWVILAIMVAAMCIMFAYFKHNKWL